MHFFVPVGRLRRKPSTCNILAGLAQQIMTATYRAYVMEQAVLRLLRHLADHDKPAALRIATEVKTVSMAMGNDRSGPLEAVPQESMLELLNLIDRASQGPPAKN